jgi:hypothetical protein
MLLKRMFGLKRDEIVGGWRKLHKRSLYSLPRAIRMKSRMRWARHVAFMGEKMTACIQGSGGKRPLGRPIHRWEDDVKMDL